MNLSTASISALPFFVTTNYSSEYSRRVNGVKKRSKIHTSYGVEDCQLRRRRHKGAAAAVAAAAVAAAPVEALAPSAVVSPSALPFFASHATSSV
jgi:hypothetical protein